VSDFYEDQATIPSERKPLSEPSPTEPSPTEPSPSSTTDTASTVESTTSVESSDVLPPDPPAEDPTEARFKSCRWYETQEGDDLPDYCSNRDVLPFAGKNAFRPDAWCADCELFKVKRITKKRKSADDWADGY
jgi:hypothetical protein